MPLTEKQMKIARVAEPRDKITGEDFKELRKASGGIVSFATGGEVKGKEPRIIELDELIEFGDDDVREIAESDRFKEDVKTFRKGGRTGNKVAMSRGCGAVVTGKKFAGTF